MKRSRYIDIYNNSCVPVTNECSGRLHVTMGQVPADLSGTLYRNGPGRFGVGPDMYSHPFDGDGMISRFQFQDGAVHYKNAYVKTAEFNLEQAAGRMLFRGFGSNRPGGFFQNALKTKFKNAANTNVISHGGRLLALWEGGWPHELDHDSLATRARYDYSGKLKNFLGSVDRILNPELPFSAHPKVDPSTGYLYNFGLAFGVKNRLMFYKVDPQGVMEAPRFIELGHLSFVHDFLITENSKAIFFCPPVHFDLPSMLLGFKTPAAGMSGNKAESVRVLVIDLNGPPGEIAQTDVQIFELPYAFVFHHINAFENDDGIQIYSSEMASFPSADAASSALAGGDLEYPLTQLVHYTLRPGNRKGIRQLYNVQGFELPRVRDRDVGRAFNSLYAAGVADHQQFPFMNEIQKISNTGVVTARFEYSEGLVGEPVHANTAGDGYLLSICYNDLIRKSELIILDPDGLTLIARLTLPHSQPIGFHGNWVANS